MAASDFVIVGGGMAGVSAGYFLCERLGSGAGVVLLEREDQLAYHTTGRSAAFYSQTYGNAIIRAITTGSRDFFESPPPGFSDHPLLQPSGALFIGREDQLPALRRTLEEGRALVASVRWAERDEILRRVPVLRPDYVAAGVLEPDSMSMDVHAIHQGFVRGMRRAGARIETGAEVTALEPRHGDVQGGGGWVVGLRDGRRLEAAVVINAAGAWCDELARLAGIPPVGLVPKRRTVILFDPPPRLDIRTWPLTIDVDEQFYFKPDAGQILASPADETPSPPCDARPEEMDVAIAVERIERATTLVVRRINHRWAGLRSFVADKTPVVGFDEGAPGFFWLAGQGGYGIQTAPGMGRLAAALATGGDVPEELARLGLRAADVAPGRLPGRGPAKG